MLRERVLREYKSNKLDAMLTTMEKRREDQNEDTLVDEVPESKDANLAFVKKKLSESKKRKKSDEMLVMNKTTCSILDELSKCLNLREFEIIREGLCEAIFKTN